MKKILLCVIPFLAACNSTSVIDSKEPLTNVIQQDSSPQITTIGKNSVILNIKYQDIDYSQFNQEVLNSSGLSILVQQTEYEDISSRFEKEYFIPFNTKNNNFEISDLPNGSYKIKEVKISSTNNPGKDFYNSNSTKLKTSCKFTISTDTTTSCRNSFSFSVFLENDTIYEKRKAKEGESFDNNQHTIISYSLANHSSEEIQDYLNSL